MRLGTLGRTPIRSDDSSLPAPQVDETERTVIMTNYDV